MTGRRVSSFERKKQVASCIAKGAVASGDADSSRSLTFSMHVKAPFSIPSRDLRDEDDDGGFAVGTGPRDLQLDCFLDRDILPPVRPDRRL